MIRLRPWNIADLTWWWLLRLGSVSFNTQHSQFSSKQRCSSDFCCWRWGPVWSGALEENQTSSRRIASAATATTTTITCFEWRRELSRSATSFSFYLVWNVYCRSHGSEETTEEKKQSSVSITPAQNAHRRTLSLLWALCQSTLFRVMKRNPGGDRARMSLM